jgi:hypothetical protein
VIQFYQAFLPYNAANGFHMWLPSNVNRYILDNRDDARAVSARTLCRANSFNPSSLSKLVSQARRFHNCGLFKSFDWKCLLASEMTSAGKNPSSNRGLPTLIWAHPHQNNGHPMSTLWILSKNNSRPGWIRNKIYKETCKTASITNPAFSIAQYIRYQNLIHFIDTLNP